MAFWIYLLRCSDGRFYTGHTDDLHVRLAQHQRGSFPTCYTYKRRPVELVWCEAFPTRDEALAAERMVGGWSRAKKDALIAGDWKTLSSLAHPPGERTTRFSTSLETNGVGEEITLSPFASSEVEKRADPKPNAGEEQA